jgi:hypothetical protein
MVNFIRFMSLIFALCSVLAFMADETIVGFIAISTWLIGYSLSEILEELQKVNKK